MLAQRADNMTDDWLYLLKKGDLAAFDTLYAKYFKLLVVSAYFYLKDQNEAMDITQNLFVDIWEKKLYENFHKDVKGYLFLAIRNRCFNLIKSKEREAEERTRYQMLHEGGIVEADLENAEQAYADHLKQLMGKLKGQRKAALNLVYLQKMKYSEAAEEMGIAVNSLKTHLKSALKFLRNNAKNEK